MIVSTTLAALLGAYIYAIEAGLVGLACAAVLWLVVTLMLPEEIP